MLNPILNAGIQPESPVEQPSILGSVAGLLNVGTAAVFGKKGQLSEADRKDAILRPFAERVNEIINQSDLTPSQQRSVVNNLTKQAVTQNPGLTGDIRKIVDDGFGIPEEVEVDLPEDVQNTAVNTFLSTPKGLITLNRAARESTKPDGSRDQAVFDKIILEGLAQETTLQANLETKRLTLESVELDLSTRNTVSQSLWEDFKPSANLIVDEVLGDVNVVVDQIRTNGSFTITEELSQSLGIPAGQVTEANLVPYLQRYRATLKSQLRIQLLDAAGLESNQLSPATEEYFNSVLAPLDAWIGLAEKDFGSATAILSSENARRELSVIRNMDPRLRATIDLLNKVPQDLKVQVFNSLSARGEVTSLMNEAFALALTADPNAIDISTTTQDMSKKDAGIQRTLAGKYLASTGLLGGAQFINAWRSFFSATDRTGELEGNFLSGASFDKIITNNLKQINESVTLNPEFIADVQGRVSNDLNITFQAAKNALSNRPELTLTVNDKGVVSVTLNRESFGVLGRPENVSEENMRRLQEETSAEILKMPEVKLLQQKLLTTQKLGSLGKTIVESVFLQAPQEQEATPTGNVLPSAQISNGPIAQKLNIDFAGFEQQFGLPGGYLERVAQIESSGNPKAQNPNSSAGGLFQQIDSNARQYGVTDKLDPLQSTEGAAKFARDNLAFLTQNLGRVPTPGELYLAHQQGPAGAARLINGSNRLAVDVVGKDAVLNNGGNLKMTAGEFANIWISKYNGQRGPTSFAQATGQQSETFVSQNQPTPEVAPLSQVSLGEGGGSVEISEAPTATESAVQAPPATSGEGDTTASQKVTQEDVEKLSEQTRKILEFLDIQPNEINKYNTREEVDQAIQRGEVKKREVILLAGELDRA